MAVLCKVWTRKILDGAFLAPQSSYTAVWKIEPGNVWWFHVVPTLGENNEPRNIQIDRVRIHSTITGDCYAHIKITNPDPPTPDYPYNPPDGCYYTLYVAVAAP
jgi:hypothetical protein